MPDRIVGRNLLSAFADMDVEGASGLKMLETVQPVSIIFDETSQIRPPPLQLLGGTSASSAAAAQNGIASVQAVGGAIEILMFTAIFLAGGATDFKFGVQEADPANVGPVLKTAPGWSTLPLTGDHSQQMVSGASAPGTVGVGWPTFPIATIIQPPRPLAVPNGSFFACVTNLLGPNQIQASFLWRQLSSA